MPDPIRQGRIVPATVLHLPGCDDVALAGASCAVPEDGLTDVHRYLVMTHAGQNTKIDVTFPGDPAWAPIAEPGLRFGHEFPAGEDPDADNTAFDPATAIRGTASPSSPHSHSHQRQCQCRNTRSAAEPDVGSLRDHE
jgi:hypothetical protein